MIRSAYYFLHRLFSARSERGAYSAGYWQALVRSQILHRCAAVSGGRVLEIGCGEGFLLRALRAQSPQTLIFGVDTDPGRVALAKRLNDEQGMRTISVSLQDARFLAFDPESFDVVIAANVFFNLPSFEHVTEVFAQMCRVVKPGGKIIFDFRNKDNFLLRVKYRFAPWYDATVKDLPLNPYSPAQIRALIAASPVRSVVWKPVGFFWKSMAPIIIVEACKS
jgi:SAM-dependent methyltransferase